MREGREDLYRRVYGGHFDAVLGFALRRVDRPEDAADVAAETFDDAGGPDVGTAAG